MRKTLVAIIAASTIGVVWADASSQEQYQQQFRDQPQARAYLSYTFGGDSHRRGLAAPLHYGLRFDYDSRLRQNSGDGVVTATPLLQFDRDNRGESMALASGVPFAAHNLRRNEDAGSGSSTSGGGSDSGWSFFDWTLLAVGIGGAGYLIYDATKGHSSPNPKSSSTTGSTTSGSTTGGGLLGTGLLGFAEVQTSYDAERDFQQQRWLDGGTGQMGDLGGK